MLSACVNCVQVLFVGGLFAQFSLTREGEHRIFQAGVREMAAVQMAIDTINNKDDGLFDELLPNTKVYP